MHNDIQELYRSNSLVTALMLFLSGFNGFNHFIDCLPGARCLSAVDKYVFADDILNGATCMVTCTTAQ